ncbi:MAG: alpha/beta fold hydrolase [Limnochordia bacterium]|nr:alpha/beta fold hydrolase [Limnochordia bacterium]
MRKQVQFANEGQTIFGILHYPEDTTGPVPGVLILHGFTGTKVEPHRVFVKMAERLVSLGIAALRFDFRGSGDSEGDFADMTLTEEISDAVVAVDYLADYPGIDSTKMGLIGLSLGGAVSACTAKLRPNLSAVVLWSAVADLMKTAIGDNVKALGVPMVEVAGRTLYDFGGNLVGMEFIEDLSNHNPPEELAGSNADVLVIHGDHDPTVPVSHSEIYRSAVAGSGGNIKVKIISGADHTYNSYHHEKELIDTTGEWLAQKLKG